MHGCQNHSRSRVVLYIANIFITIIASYITNAAGISDTFLQASPISWIQFIGGGWVGGGWGEQWGAIGGFLRTFERKSSHCVFIEVHRQPQFTCQAGTVADSSLTPSIALLVCPRGTTHSIVDCREFTGSHAGLGMMLVKVDLAICSSAIGVSG